MNKRRRALGKSRRHQICLVSIVTVVVIAAIIFVACKERFVFILPGLALLVSVFATIIHLFQVYCELRSRQWPMATGSIRSNRIVRSYAPSGGMWAGNSSPPHTYSIAVEYDYVVADKRYEGTRVSFVKKDYNSWKAANAARLQFLQRKNINVFYCPSIPSMSCITHLQFRDIVISVGTMAAFSVVLLMFTLLAFYYLP